MARGGARKGAGRKPGSQNKRTQERIAAFRSSGKKDPLESITDLHEQAIAAHRKACQALAAFEKKYKKQVALLNEPLGLNTQAMLMMTVDQWAEFRATHDRLVAAVDKRAAQINAYANDMNPYLHSRLALSEARVDVTTHEAALDELDWK